MEAHQRKELPCLHSFFKRTTTTSSGYLVYLSDKTSQICMVWYSLVFGIGLRQGIFITSFDIAPLFLPLPNLVFSAWCPSKGFLAEFYVHSAVTI